MAWNKRDLVNLIDHAHGSRDVRALTLHVHLNGEDNTGVRGSIAEPRGGSGELVA